MIFGRETLKMTEFMGYLALGCLGVTHKMADWRRPAIKVVVGMAGCHFELDGGSYHDETK